MECDVSVTLPTLSNTKVSLYVGETNQLTVNHYSSSIQWASSDSKVVSVKNGVITAKKKGSATISAKFNKDVLNCKVTVKNPEISNTKLSMYKSEKKKLEIKGASKKITWKSADKSIAIVSTNGTVTGKSIGKTTITATVAGKTYKCVVTVKRQTPNFTTYLSNILAFDSPIVLLHIKNNGSFSMTLTADNSYIIDDSNDSYSRKLYIADQDNSLKKIKSLVIKPGKEASVRFMLDGKDAWYDGRIAISYTVKYDGKNYVYTSSNYYSTRLLK